MSLMKSQFYKKPVRYIPVASIKMGGASAKCAMCGKMAIISDEHDSNQNHIMIEQIDGTSYTFDSDKCAMMFKRFSSVYGNNFADE
jgi:hypothetical protein